MIANNVGKSNIAPEIISVKMVLFVLQDKKTINKHAITAIEVKIIVVRNII